MKAPRPLPTSVPKPLSDRLDINTDLKSEEFGEPTAKPSQFLPVLTPKEYEDAREAREEAFKPSGPSDSIRCPDCAVSFTGKREFKHHVKDVHHWKPRRILKFFGETSKQYKCPACLKRFISLHHLNTHGKTRHNLSVRAMRRLLNPKPSVVPDRSPASPFTPEQTALLKKSGLKACQIASINPSEMTPELWEMFAHPNGSSKSIHTIPLEDPRLDEIAMADAMADASAYAAAADSIQTTSSAEDGFDALFNSPLSRIIPDATDRECFVRSILGGSGRDIAIALFKDPSKRPRVQKMVERATKRFSAYAAVKRHQFSQNWERQIAKALERAA